MVLPILIIFMCVFSLVFYLTGFLVIFYLVKDLRIFLKSFKLNKTEIKKVKNEVL